MDSDNKGREMTTNIDQISVAVNYVKVTYISGWPAHLATDIATGALFKHKTLAFVIDTLIDAQFDKLADSGHFQIVGGSADTQTTDWYEIEVQSQLANNAVWNVVWADADGNGPRPHFEDVNGEENTSFLEVSRKYEVSDLSFGNKAGSNLWNQMIAVANAIDEAEIPYLALTQNSNSFVASVLWSIGIDITADWQNRAPIDVTNMPGVNQNVIQYSPVYGEDISLELVGVGSDSDVFNGGLGDDELFGNGGADYLSGGSGTNTLVGGEGADHFALGNQYWLIDQVTGDVGRSSVPNALFLRE